MKTFLVPLTPEEETDCLCRLKNGEQGAKEELVLHNMRLVAHVAKKYVSSEEEQEDLISIGTIGLMKAVDSFRPEYGNKFATYAIRCVDNELLMHLRSKKKQRKEVSMFEPIGTDKEGNQIQLVDVLEFHDKNVADEVTKREQMKKICTFMNDVLSEREAFIIRRRYGIGGNQELTHTDANNKSIKILIVLLMLSSLLWTITMMRKSTIPTKMQAGKLSRYCVSKLKLRGASERSSATYWNANKEIAMSTIKSRIYHLFFIPKCILKHTIHPLQKIRNPHTTD